MIDKVHIAAGISFLVLNILGQFMFSEMRGGFGSLQIIGLILHIIAGLLLIVSMLMLVQTVCQGYVMNNRVKGQVDVDMLIAYTLFSFTGFAITCAAVYLRSGSHWWNMFTILVGGAASVAADPYIRSKFFKKSPLGSSEVCFLLIRHISCKFTFFSS